MELSLLLLPPERSDDTHKFSTAGVVALLVGVGVGAAEAELSAVVVSSLVGSNHSAAGNKVNAN